MAKRETIAEQAHKHYEPGVPFEIPIPTESVYHLLEDAAKRYPNTAALATLCVHGQEIDSEPP